MNAREQHLQQQTRRYFFQQAGLGLGSIALSQLLTAESHADVKTVPNPLAPSKPHFLPRAKRVIYLHMTGSPPNLDLYDYRPVLVQRDNQDCPD